MDTSPNVERIARDIASEGASAAFHLAAQEALNPSPAVATLTPAQYAAVIRAAQARALRDAAEVLPCATEGPDRIGTARWKQPARNGYSIAIEEAQIALRARADEIEAGR